MDYGGGDGCRRRDVTFACVTEKKKTQDGTTGPGNNDDLGQRGPSEVRIGGKGERFEKKM